MTYDMEYPCEIHVRFTKSQADLIERMGDKYFISNAGFIRACVIEWGWTHDNNLKTISEKLERTIEVLAAIWGSGK